MRGAPLPANEKERLAYLHSMGVLDTPPEPTFDRLVRLAGKVTGSPMALVSLVDADRTWYKARLGVGLTEGSRTDAFCAFAILQEEPLVVCDTFNDARFADNPLVLGEPHLRFYAGVPLTTEFGAVGTLCVFDTKPHVLDAKAIEGLRLLGEAVTEALVHREASARSARQLHWLRCAEEMSQIGHYHLEPDGQVFWSPEVYSIHGLDPADEPPPLANGLRVFHGSGEERPYPLVRQVAEAGAPLDVELRLRREDGELRWVRTIARADFDPETGELASVTGALQDITDQKLLHSQQLYREKLISLGLVAATTAHEISNPLASIQLNADLIRQELRKEILDRESIDAAARDLIRGVTHIGGVADELRAIAGPNHDELMPVPLGRAVTAALRLSQVRLYVLDVRNKVVGELASLAALANEARLVQVLSNLLVNASRALCDPEPDATSMTSMTSADPVSSLAPSKGAAPKRRMDKPVVVIRAGIVNDKRVFLEVEDSGPGMDERLRQRIFDPFVTTKLNEPSAGLGLYVCRELIQSFGGTIGVRSALGQGTTLRIELPKADGQPDALTKPKPKRAIARGRILVIDDDAMVGRAFVRTLRGYDVTFEQDPCRALERLRAGDEEFAVVLCDLSMPVMDGVTLHGQVVASRPELDERFIFVTGGGYSVESRVFAEQNAARIHPKPVNLPRLLAAIEELQRRFDQLGVD